MLFTISYTLWSSLNLITVTEPLFACSHWWSMQGSTMLCLRTSNNWMFVVLSCNCSHEKWPKSVLLNQTKTFHIPKVDPVFPSIRNSCCICLPEFWWVLTEIWSRLHAVKRSSQIYKHNHVAPMLLIFTATVSSTRPTWLRLLYQRSYFCTLSY